MSGEGAPNLVVEGAGLRVGVVVTSWHPTITDALLDRALDRLARAGVEGPTVVRCAGAFELPVVAQALAAGHDAVVALGLVLRGQTAHFDYICSAATDGLLRVSLDSGKPVGFGVLQCDNEQQARARAGFPDSPEDIGAEAVEAALSTAGLLRTIRG